MVDCPWCQHFDVIPVKPEKELCIKHLREFAQKFPDRAARRRRK